MVADRRVPLCAVLLPAAHAAQGAQRVGGGGACRSVWLTGDLREDERLGFRSVERACAVTRAVFVCAPGVVHASKAMARRSWWESERFLKPTTGATVEVFACVVSSANAAVSARRVRPGGGGRTGAWLSDREVDAVIFRLSGRLVGLLFGRARAACGREARFWPRNRVLARNSGLVDRKGKSLEAKGQVSKIVTVELLPRRARTRFRGQKWRVFLHGRGLRWLLRSGRPHQWLRTARRRAFRTWRIRARGGGLTSLRHSVIKRRDWVARAGKGCRIDSRVEGVSRCA